MVVNGFIVFDSHCLDPSSSLETAGLNTDVRGVVYVFRRLLQI